MQNCKPNPIPTSTKPHQSFSYSNGATNPQEQSFHHLQAFNNKQYEMNKLHNGGSSQLNVVQFDTVNPAGPQSPSLNSQVGNQNLLNQKVGAHYDNYAYCKDGETYNPPGTPGVAPGIKGGKKIRKSKKNKSRKNKSRKHKSRKVRRF